MSEPIISVSGLRGIIGEQLTPAVAIRFAAALATTLPAGESGTVVIGRDGRQSGRMIGQAVAASLTAHGLNVADLGCAATPTVGVEVRRHGAIAGIQISASHNPRHYNGMKLFGADGRVLPKTQAELVLAAYRESKVAWVNVDRIGSEQVVEDPHAAHLERVLATVDVESIRKRSFRVLLDSNHGAGAALGRRLLDALGCEVTVLGEQPNGQFWHTPEPLEGNLVEVSSQAAKKGFDVTFCQDPDADRLAVIDEKGMFIGEELTLALCLLQALPSLAPGVVVTNCATSGLSQKIAGQFGCRLLQSAVGEANVVDLMLSQDAIFGGEGNGGPIDPKVGLVRDSFVGMARILQLLASTKTSISQIVGTLPKLSIVKDKIDLPPSKLPALFERIVKTHTDAIISHQDGLKLTWHDRWLLVRGSNTEPIVRLIAEASQPIEAQQLCDNARDLADEIL